MRVYTSFLCTATEVTIGLQHTAYAVTEDTGLVFVCVDILSGSIAGRTISIDYHTSDDVAEGKLFHLVYTII